MIKIISDGTIYICKKDVKPLTFEKFTGEIQHDTDFLGRDRTVGYSKKGFNPMIDSHRIDLSKNPGEIFEYQKHYVFWLFENKKDVRESSKSAFIDVTILGEGIGHCVCSNCNQFIDTGDNYCRFCGSKFVSRRIIGGIYGRNKK